MIDSHLMIGTLASIPWQPHIGDPTLLGWVVTCLYTANALLYLYQGVRQRRHHRVAFLWTVLGLVLAFLALNKQWDLQVLFTQIGRHLAQTQGLLAYRRTLQAIFVIVLALTVGVVGFLIHRTNHRQPQLGKTDLLGWSLLALFLLIRTATDYHILPAISGLTAPLLELTSLVILVFGQLRK
jgi:hypothetical protein